MIQFASQGFKYGESMSHKQARLVIELYLIAKGRTILENNFFYYPEQFIKKHKLEKRFKGHAYDILTNSELIEIDGMQTRHSKTSQKINDGVASEFATNHLSQWKFYRLLKEELVDRRGVLQPTAAEYLKEHLF
jgi:hypothetical protein